jgi:hypothetical protein
MTIVVIFIVEIVLVRVAVGCSVGVVVRGISSAASRGACTLYSVDIFNFTSGVAGGTYVTCGSSVGRAIGFCILVVSVCHAITLIGYD